MQKQRRSYARALRHISPAASGHPSPQVDGVLYVAVCARRTRGGDGFSVLSQPKTRPDEIVELYLERDPHRQLEALHLLAPVLVDSVGICTSEPNLFVPERGEIQAAPRPRHPDKRYRPPGGAKPGRVLYRPRGADAIEDLLRPAHAHRLATFWRADTHSP